MNPYRGRKRNWYNGSSYYDPTAGQALENLSREEEKRKLRGCIGVPSEDNVTKNIQREEKNEEETE